MHSSFISVFTVTCFFVVLNACCTEGLSSSLCSPEYYFSTISLNCTLCPSNQTSSTPDSCHCLPGYVEEKNMCVPCPAMYGISTDQKFCIKCPDNAVFDEDRKFCKCKKGQILIDRLQNGTRLEKMDCISCADGTIANEEKNLCVSCHESFLVDDKLNCSCGVGHVVLDGQCIKLSELTDIPDRESSYAVQFSSGLVKSDLFHKYYRSAAHGCKFNANRTSCHILANMCVLLHYSYDNELSVCSYYRTYFGKYSVDRPAHVPWLYYDIGEAPEILFSKDISSIYSFKPNHKGSFLNFTVAKFSMNGTLIKYGKLDETLEVCSLLRESLSLLMQFGTSFKSNCDLKVDSIWDQFDSYFYEIFLHFWDEVEMSYKSFPIPILITNFQLERSKVNLREKKKWQLVRRFFVFDNISGKEHNQKQGIRASVVRYIKNINVKINKRPGDSHGLIYPPLIVLTYEEENVEQYGIGKTVEVSMQVSYSDSFANSKKDVSIAVAVMCIFAVLWSIVETYSWGRRSGKVGIDLSGVMKLVLVSCGNIANVFFLVQFCSCLYWTLIFKRQDVVFMFLPSPSEEFLIKQYIISAFSLKFVHLAYVLYEQMTVDLFLIDWEKPRAKNTIPHPQLSKKKKKHETVDIKNEGSVSIWRIYFIANEWNEIQTLRKINLGYQLVGMLFLLKVLDLESWTTYDPNSSTHKLPVVVSFSFVTRFALSISVYFLLVSIQLIFRTAFYERYIEHKLQQFVDLCSMANISVFILQQPLYGYYIHGRSVHGFADSDMQTFYDNLRREEEDLCAYRGLEASSDCQTFEVITTYKFRDEYLRILGLSSEPAHGPASNHSRRSRINSLKVEQTVKSHEKMKAFFEMFLQHSSSEVDYVVKDKLFLENLLDVEFQGIDDKCLFFRDLNYLFNRVLFYGQETLLVSFEMLLFSFVDLLSHNYILAALVTYIVACAIKMIRNSGGKRNLVKKTLVDQRFLI